MKYEHARIVYAVMLLLALIYLGGRSPGNSARFNAVAILGFGFWQIWGWLHSRRDENSE